MAKGAKAKDNITKLIINALGDSFITIADKKIYTWAEDENNEKVQIAITMTMPKVAIEAGAQTVGSTNQNGASTNSVVNMPTELASEDKQQVEALKNKLREMGVYKE